MRGLLRRRVLAASPSLEDARAAFLYAYTNGKVKSPVAFASTILARREGDTLPIEVGDVARLSAVEIARDGAWERFVGAPEEFPWHLWFTTWEEVSQFAPEGEPEPLGDKTEPNEAPPPCLYGECEKARDVWKRALGKLQIQFFQETFQMWLAGTVALGMDGEVLVVGVMDETVRKRLETRMYRQIRWTLDDISPGLKVRYEILTGAGR